MHGDETQEWSIDPDPALSSLNQTLDVGSLQNRSVVNVSGDVYFLSSAGFRSIAVQNTVDSLMDTDVGSPVDKLVSAFRQKDVMALYNNRDGQYWCHVDGVVWVYTFSKLAKLSAWSYYTYPFDIDDMILHKGDVYFRSGSHLYRSTSTSWKDANPETNSSQIYRVQAEFSDLDFKANTSLKQIHSFDVAQTGACSVSFQVGSGVSSTKTTTHTVTVTGDKRDTGMIALPLIATHVAPTFTNEDSLEWELFLVNLAYDPMGVL
jgi:hypothetical protein